MSLTRQRKAALDLATMDFNRWSTRVLTLVYGKYPRAHVTMRELMILYLGDIHPSTAARHLQLKHHAIHGG